MKVYRSACGTSGRTSRLIRPDEPGLFHRRADVGVNWIADLQFRHQMHFHAAAHRLKEGIVCWTHRYETVNEITPGNPLQLGALTQIVLILSEATIQNRRPY